MKSSEGEKIILESVIDTTAARGQVEKWLLELEISMKKSVKSQVSPGIECTSIHIHTYHTYGYLRTFVNRWHGQRMRF